MFAKIKDEFYSWAYIDWQFIGSVVIPIWSGFIN